MASFETFVPIDRAGKNYGLNPPSKSTSQTTLIRGNLCVVSGRKLKPACVELALVRGTAPSQLLMSERSLVKLLPDARETLLPTSH
jgi:hypothetical protein